MSLPRRYVKCEIDNKPTPKAGYKPVEKGVIVPEQEANLVSSKLEYEHMNLHAPALDVDHKVQCYESSTPGHYHILIDVPMPWWKYRALMWWMAKCGILEKGYYKASAKKKASYLRKKGVLKPDAKSKWGSTAQGSILAASSPFEFTAKNLEETFKSAKLYATPMHITSLPKTHWKFTVDKPKESDPLENENQDPPKSPEGKEEWETWQ